MRISDWSSDVCSSDLPAGEDERGRGQQGGGRGSLGRRPHRRPEVPPRRSTRPGDRQAGRGEGRDRPHHPRRPRRPGGRHRDRRFGQVQARAAEDRVLTPQENKKEETKMAELTINTADIAAALKKNLEDFKPSVDAAQVGRVIEVGDGIATVSGLPGVGVNELLEFEGGVRGLALNLDEDSTGAVVLGDTGAVSKGSTVKATGQILSVPAGDGLLGRVVDALDRKSGV